MTTLSRLSKWYLQQCDGEWEHSWGFSIGTLDNPGVAVDIDLIGTPLEKVPFEELRDEHESSDRWLICMRTDTQFQGRGGPTRLDDILTIFLDWAERNQSHPIESL